MPSFLQAAMKLNIIVFHAPVTKIVIWINCSNLNGYIEWIYLYSYSKPFILAKHGGEWCKTKTRHIIFYIQVILQLMQI